MKILVTGAAGFIGYHTCLRLLARGDRVFGVDTLDRHFGVGIKKARLDELVRHPEFRYKQVDISKTREVEDLFDTWTTVRSVIHLAGQAGVRQSMDEPATFVQSNLVGFANILEESRKRGIYHLMYASSSSVYGVNRVESRPSDETRDTSHPLSLYAATKKANEVMAEAYAHLYGLKLTGLRFFTVYGPFGRPDMAVWKFTEAIYNEKPLDVYGFGTLKRDFTYIDDAVESIVRLLERQGTDHKILNVGTRKPVELTKVLNVLRKLLGKDPKMNLLPAHKTDVQETWAETTELRREIGVVPETSIEEGLAKFVQWYIGWRTIKENA